MSDRGFALTRRTLLAGLGASTLGVLAPPALAQGRPPGRSAALALQAKPTALSLRPGLPDTPIWALQRAGQDSELKFARGDELAVSLDNALPSPLALSWRGIDGAAATEPLAARPPLATGTQDSVSIALRHAGTFLCDPRLLGDSAALPLSPRALIVAETAAIDVDRDDVLLIEDWRLRADGGALAPGSAAADAKTIYTVNGKPSVEIKVRSRDRLRLRFINGCQRHVIAVRIEDHEVRVMAIDGQPAEPFLARDGQLVLAPGTRIDAFVDATQAPGSTSSILLSDGTEPRAIGRLITADPPARPALLPPAPPLPSNGLPAQLDLKNALRVDLALAPSAGWVTPLTWTASAVPAFRAKRGRTVVLALDNGAATPTTFHLHGHHFRLLDRLDDGWKPFWLDTLLIPPNQTQRIAFAAEYPGMWLLEAMAMDWSAPRLLRSYTVV